MPTYDFSCECGLVEEDVYYPSWRHIPNAFMCSACGSPMKQLFRGGRNFIHPSHSGMYGRPQPALGGDVIEDYAHKQRIMREMGIKESADKVSGARLYRDRVAPPDSSPRPRKDWAWGDAPKDAK